MTIFGVSISKRALAMLVSAGVVLTVLGVIAFNSYSTLTTTQGVTICGKESVSIEDGHEYRVYTSAGTYKVTDKLVGGSRFDSADFYGTIVVGKVYTVVSYGWRIPISSQFPNIDSLTLSTQSPRGCS